jgi:Gram-negative bacterial TonB protein C-terminal
MVVILSKAKDPCILFLSLFSLLGNPRLQLGPLRGSPQNGLQPLGYTQTMSDSQHSAKIWCGRFREHNKRTFAVPPRVDSMIFPTRHSLIKPVAIGLMIFCWSLARSQAQVADHELPLVIKGDLPLYPLVALHARIEGVVRITVNTDGSRVSSLRVESGPPMLAKAAEENIQSWRFTNHKPTSFVTTYEYQIKEPSHCYFNNGSAVLNVPLKVQITVNGIETCDPAVIRH